MYAEYEVWACCADHSCARAAARVTGWDRVLPDACFVDNEQTKAWTFWRFEHRDHNLAP